MARRIKSLFFGSGLDKNRQSHREHRSKRGRNKMNRAHTDDFYKKKREKEALKFGVDKKSLRYIQKKYNICI